MLLKIQKGLNLPSFIPVPYPLIYIFFQTVIVFKLYLRLRNMTIYIPLRVLDIRLYFPMEKQISFKKSDGFAHIEEEFEQLFLDLNSHEVSFHIYFLFLNHQDSNGEKQQLQLDNTDCGSQFMYMEVSLQYPELCSVFSSFAIHQNERFS